MNKTTPFILIIIFLLLSIPNIYYPGISIDEAEDGILCGYILKNKPDGFQSLLGDYVVLFNKIIPIINGPYTGAVPAYLMFIFSRLFGIGVLSLRLTPIFTSAISLLFIFYFCKMWFGHPVAFVATLLTATNLFFVQYSRVGFYREEIFVMSFFWAGLFFFVKYSEKQRVSLLYLGFFLFGLGLSSKITFLWYILGMGAAYVLLRKRLHLLVGLNKERSLAALLSFCLGAFYLILFNLKRGGATVKRLVDSLMYSTPAKVNNLAYLTNLQGRIKDLTMLLRGCIYERVDWGVAKMSFIEQISPIFVGLALVSFVSVLLFTVFSRNSPKLLRYRVLFFYALYITVFLCTPFTVGNFHPGHLLVLLPFPFILLALFLDYVWRWTKQKRIVLNILYSVFLVPILVFNVWMNVHFNIEMKENGGYRRWSTAVYELASYLQDKRIYTPVTFGFGLKHNIAFLSNCDIIPIQLDENCSLEYVKEEYRRLSLRKEPIFFLTKNSEDYMPNLNLFMRLVVRDGKKKTLDKVFLNRAGKSVYWLYKII